MKSTTENLEKIQSIADKLSANPLVPVLSGFPFVTGGVLDLAQKTNCFWLLNAIGFNQINGTLKDFQVWELDTDSENNKATLFGYNFCDTEPIVEEIRKKENNTATVIMRVETAHADPIIKMELPDVEIPPDLEEVQFFFINNAILFLSECWDSED